MHLREAIARHTAKNALGVDFDKSAVERRLYLDWSDTVVSQLRTFLDHNMAEKLGMPYEERMKILNLLEEEHMP